MTCGAVGAAAVSTPGIAHAASEKPSPSPPLESLGSTSFGSGSDISLEGRARIAEVNRQFQQQQPAMENTVNAVDGIGLDPSGGTPINGTFSSAISGMSNTRIVFPGDGTFALSEQITARPDGPIEIVGNGCSFVIPPNTEMKSLIFDLPGGSLIDSIVIDQSATGALQEFGVQTDGVVRVDNVTIKGYAPAKESPEGGDGGSGVDAMFSPIARTENAVVRATNFTAVGGSAAGTHDEGDKPPDAPENVLDAPMGIWVGSQTQGTIQMVNPTLSGWSNGMYAGRTKGVVEVRGGRFVNNFNSQTRIGGGSVVDGASMLLDDRQWSDKGPFKIGHQGVHAARVDAKKGNQTDPCRFVNVRVVAQSMRKGSSLFNWESESGPGIIRNCHITHHLDRPVVLGDSPSAPAATNIQMDQCLIEGTSTGGVMECEGREQSRIQRTCIKLPNAGPDDIQGAQIGQGVSFGKQCQSGSGLAAPKKVGSGGNLSSLPAPTNSGPGFFEGIANYVVGGFRDLTRGLLKGFAAILIAPFIVLILIFLLLFGPLFVVIAFLIAGQKSLKK